MKEASGEINIPNHIAFIMDGNRRWAKKLGKSIDEGHKEGYQRFKEIVDYSFSLGIKYVTVYAFSTENWNRPKSEVSGIMSIARFVADNELTKYAGRKTRVRIIGRHEELPKDIQSRVIKVEADTKDNNENNLNVAFAYGGRAEIIDSVKRTIDLGQEITEENISSHLYTENQPEPDMIVRTGGSPRLSNFLMWQSAYSEIYLTDTLWPDFSKEELVKSLDFYSKIKRNFGK